MVDKAERQLTMVISTISISPNALRSFKGESTLIVVPLNSQVRLVFVDSVDLPVAPGADLAYGTSGGECRGAQDWIRQEWEEDEKKVREQHFGYFKLGYLDCLWPPFVY